jgi:bifunctional non-homologous end joining protein LigD
MPSTVKKQLEKYRSMRDFQKTAEPAGGAAKGKAVKSPKSKLHFVIQKHAASHLHFDLRLELEGVMKSWAVPKGPSLDPSMKRLAMQVEDHPFEYNKFEGTIPKGEYGGGTVMIWDRGTYSADKAANYDGDHSAAVSAGLAKGDLKFSFHGKRLQGSFVLVRTRMEGGKAQWLLMKHRDEFARPGSDIVAEEMTSVATGRTMEEIAGGKSKVWHSNREPKGARALGRTGVGRRASGKSAPKRTLGAKKPLELGKTAITPMLASLGKEMPEGEAWTFEPKFDGIRVLAFVTPSDVRLITRNAKDKTKQFPEVVTALAKLPGKTGRILVLDGEIVALAGDDPARFQELQSRMHVENELAISRLSKDTPSALLAFDILVDGDDILLNEPWSERRKRLQKRLGRKKLKSVRLAESSPDGAAVMAQAIEGGWEGVIAKRTDSLYRPGARSKDWLKLKLERSQEFVVGGFTEPRNSREHLGAILLGYYNDEGELVYAGHTGGGFSSRTLADIYARLKPLERSTPPFSTRPKTNEKPHWVEPNVVVEVRFNEWTNEGKLRQPIFLGVRDDKSPRDVTREA